MNTYKNFLSSGLYLIDNKLHKFLEDGSSIRYGDKSVVKDIEGTYLVLVRVLNHESKVIIYNYIFYPNIFGYALNYFLFQKQDFINSTLYSEWGDYVTILNNNKFVDNRLQLNENSEYLSNWFDNKGINSDIEIRNYVDMYLFINKLAFVGDYDIISDLVDLAVKKNHKEFANIIFDNKHTYELFNRTFRFNIEDTNDIKNPNIINGCLFVVDDLSMFLTKIKSKGYVINAGPQKWRGQVNSMNNFLTCLDIDFRYSLYKHNEYHVNYTGLGSNTSLSKSKFSYRNIHQNICGVRWYSTNTRQVSSKASVKFTNTNKKKSISENSPIFGYLNQWLSKSPINDITQEKLEKYLLDYTYIGIDNNKSNPLIDYNLFSNTLVKLLIESKKELLKIINNFRSISHDKKGKKKLNQKETSVYFLSLLLKEISNDEVIAIMYGRLMRLITKYNRFYTNDTALDIFQDMCDNLIKDYWFSLYNKHIYVLHKELMDTKGGLSVGENELITDSDTITKELRKNYSISDWKQDYKDFVDVFNNITLKSNIGGIIAEWMVECNLIKTEVVILGRREKKSIIIPTERVLKSVGTNINKLASLPMRIPMIVKPKPYYRETIKGKVIERLGGYLLNDVKTSDRLILENWELKEPTILDDSNVIYGLVNNMNSVAYKINKDLLNFIDVYGVQYDLILYKDHPLSDKPVSSLKKWEKIELESDRNKKELQENILGLAQVYSQLHEFYLPIRVDFRGRMYCISEYLTYQSNELAKSLLLFSNGEKLIKTDIRAINYFKAYGANCFGNKLDKKSWNERTKWIDDNINDIINYHNGKLIAKATNKLLFIAFCIEYSRFLKSLDNVDTSYFETYLPIQLDATCNGYQHLSLLSLDLSLAKELNLTTSTWDDVPKDFYNFLSTNLIDYFRNMLNNKELEQIERDDYTRLSNLNLVRAIVKKAIMTIPYNVSTIQMIKYIRENFELCSNQDNNSDFKDTWYQFTDDHSIKLKQRDFTKIGLGLREVLSTKFFRLKLLMKYLKNIAKICTRLDLAIPWGLPSGVVVRQSYLGTDEVRLRPFTFSKSKFTMRVPNNKKINSSKQIRAFMPNLIHSLDAASLALLVDLYFSNQINCKFKNIYAVHDCFAVTANNVENLMELLKLVYIKIYSDGTYLKDLDKEIKHQIKVHYGDNSLDENTMTLKIMDMPKINFPDINEVIGTELPNSSYNTNVLKSSSYLIN